MRKRYCLAWFMILLVVGLPAQGPGSQPGQRSKLKNAEAAWPSFWIDFRKSVRRRNQVALRSMISDEFKCTCTGDPKDGFIRLLYQQNMWRDVLKASKSDPYFEGEIINTSAQFHPAHSDGSCVLIFSFQNSKWRLIYFDCDGGS